MWDIVALHEGIRVAGLLPPCHRDPSPARYECETLIFRGTFEYALDAKHRLTVPVKYRAALAGGVVLTFSLADDPADAHALSIWQAEVYDARAERALANVNPISGLAIKTNRMLNNYAWELELDAASRLMIPAKAREWAGLDRDVVITGSGDCLEVWDSGAHETYSQSLIGMFQQIVASFDHAG